jgi:hypothetical protein
MSGQFFHQGLKDTFQTVLERINIMYHSKHGTSKFIQRRVYLGTTKATACLQLIQL